ncbi:hypothetical protein FHY05_003326 [Sphingomonas sp. BK580]|nr:hypothetical protein [Sphingomonas sp. BK580]
MTNSEELLALYGEADTIVVRCSLQIQVRRSTSRRFPACR